jgi:hypothetical protein
MPYAKYLKHLDNSQKEYLFRADLARRLTVLNYMIAKPEPDVGEDVWIARRDEVSIYPAQVKASYGVRYIQNERIRRYITTIKAAKMSASFGRKFIYFFGLYIPDSNPVEFQVGCIPSSFFEAYFEFLMEQRYQRKNRRLNIEIDHNVPDGRFFMFRQSIEVTDYFKRFDAISG